jgi:hypothetical protein
VKKTLKKPRQLPVKTCRCGRRFYQTRVDKETCSNGCAVAAWRLRKLQERSINDAT